MTQEQMNELAVIIARLESLTAQMQSISDELRAIEQSQQPAADEQPAPVPLYFIFASDELEV